MKLITIRQIAELCSVSQNTVRNWANGGYYNGVTGEFVAKDFKFPEPRKVIGQRRFFADVDVKRWLNLRRE